jgi:hypothetical protein
MEWVLWGVVGPLTLASVLGCREQRALRRSRQTSFRALSLDDRRAFGRFVRGGEPLDHRLLPVAMDWAEGILEPDCRWIRYLYWTWAFWFTLGAVLAVAFGTARDITVRFLLLDLILLAATAALVARRRARAVLAAAGHRPPGR